LAPIPKPPIPNPQSPIPILENHKFILFKNKYNIIFNINI